MPASLNLDDNETAALVALLTEMENTPLPIGTSHEGAAGDAR
jgi:hypothetical protein